MKTLVEAVNDGLHTEMERDPSVMVMGEDVGTLGGVFRATAGLRDRFGSDRCVDTPLAEAGILGAAVGPRHGGLPARRARCSTTPSPTPASTSSSATSAATAGARGGAMEFPITVRMPYGGRVRAPELHDDSPEAYYVHTPGDQGGDPVDAGRRQGPARRGDPRRRPGRDPRAQAHLPDGARRGARGRARGAAREGARIARSGSDVTVIAYGAMVAVAEAAADRRRRVGRGARPALAEAARRAGPARVGGPHRPGGGRRRGAARRRLRGRGRGRPRREGDPRPARTGRARDGLRRPVPVLDDRGRLPAVPGACARRG